MSGWHGSVRHLALLGTRADQAWSCGAPDAAGLRQAVCEAWEDRRSRCGSGLRSGKAADDALWVDCSNGLSVEPPCARITSGASAANSCACLRMSAQRVSILTLRPMTQPDWA